jgi:hypothetical protein
MIWTKEKLEELKGFGTAFFSIKKTAFCMEMNVDELKKEIDKTGSEAHLAYYGGLYESEAKVNKGIIELAANGSNAAQIQALKLVEYCENENKL